MSTNNIQQELGKTLWSIANNLRGAMMADDFRDYMLSFLFWKYLSDNYLIAAKKELGADYIEQEESKDDSRKMSPLQLWYKNNPDDALLFERQMRRKIHPCKGIIRAFQRCYRIFLSLHKTIIPSNHYSPDSSSDVFGAFPSIFSRTTCTCV